MIEDYTLCHDEIAHVVEMMYTSRMRLDDFEGNVSRIESFFGHFRCAEVYERWSSSPIPKPSRSALLDRSTLGRTVSDQ